MPKLSERPRVGVGVVVFEKGSLLMGKRKGAHGAGTWALPGGHLEYKEDVIACARRELYEETGIEALSIQEGPWSNDMIEGKHYLTVFAIVTAFKGEPIVREPEKCLGWDWFSPFELPTPLFAPAERVLKSLIAPPLKIAYLAAPYNDPDPKITQERTVQITRIAADLFQQGIAVFSPITHNVPLCALGAPGGWAHWEAYDLSMVGRCDKLIVLKLPGWERSKGVQAEIAHAKRLGLPIEMLEPTPPND